MDVSSSQIVFKYGSFKGLWVCRSPHYSKHFQFTLHCIMWQSYFEYFQNIPDFKAERNSLPRHAYPELSAFCSERGLDFQVVDMRWGITDDVINDHHVTDLCIREIALCQQISCGPNFVASIVCHSDQIQCNSVFRGSSLIDCLFLQ